MNCRFASLLFAIFILPAAGGSDGAVARPERASVATAAQMLFGCHTDRLLTLRRSDDSRSEQSFAVSGRRAIPGEVRLTINTDTRAMTLLVQLRGKPRHAYALSDVEQGGSPGSGAGGRADTTIRGRSGDSVFTLFAGYDSNGIDHDASLQVEGRNSFLLTCDDDQYLAPPAKGMGRFGSTSIYVLSADGLAKELKELPVEPGS